MSLILCASAKKLCSLKLKHALKPFQIATITNHERSIIGKREIVGYGCNGQPMYVDREDFPFPALRWKEPSCEIDALREKEKGDWNNLTCEEKKALYRASDAKSNGTRTRKRKTLFGLSNKSKIPSKPKIPYRSFHCKFCDKGCTSKKLLENHQKCCSSEYLPESKLTAKRLKIPKTIESKPRVRLKKPQPCKKCPLIFTTTRELKEHRKIHLPNELEEEHTYKLDETLDLYICNTCSAEFQDRIEIDKHLASHEKKYGCSQCPEKFKKLRELCYHMIKHPDEGKICCPVCSFKTITRTKLLTHLNVTHLNTNICKTCGRVCKSRKLLEEHQFQHSNRKEFPCVVCAKAFPYEKSLFRHQTKFHKVSFETTPVQYPCPVCKTKYSSPALLQMHTEKAHTKDFFKNPNTVIKNCLCDTCGQGFKSNVHLKKHLVAHTDIRPHTCTHCGRGFKHKYALTYHERIHTGERPYNCEYCGKSFRQNTPFRVHLRTHTGEKPYVCSICCKGFTTNQGLKLHVKNCFINSHGIGCF